MTLFLGILQDIKNSFVLTLAYTAETLALVVSSTSSGAAGCFGTTGAVNRNDLVTDGIYATLAVSRDFSGAVLKASEEIIDEVLADEKEWTRVRVPRPFLASGGFESYGPGNLPAKEQEMAERRAAVIIKRWLRKKGDKARLIGSFVANAEQDTAPRYGILFASCCVA